MSRDVVLKKPAGQANWRIMAGVTWGITSPCKRFRTVAGRSPGGCLNVRASGSVWGEAACGPFGSLACLRRCKPANTAKRTRSRRRQPNSRTDESVDALCPLLVNDDTGGVGPPARLEPFLPGCSLPPFVIVVPGPDQRNGNRD